MGSFRSIWRVCRAAAEGGEGGEPSEGEGEREGRIELCFESVEAISGLRGIWRASTRYMEIGIDQVHFVVELSEFGLDMGDTGCLLSPNKRFLREHEDTN